MEALPIFLDSLVPAWGAILISVTLILLFGEIIPQAVCSRYGLAIGAMMAPVVRILLLDFLLGDGHEALFRRAELKTLVDLHGNEAGKGGELTHDETTIIAGALDLAEKKARDAMTPIWETFVIDVNARLDRGLTKLILDKGHSRVPVYYQQPTNIIGLILVKNLLTINPEDAVPVKHVAIRRIPRVPETMPLYDILNEFQKGHNHMAAVIKQQTDPNQQRQTEGYSTDERDVTLDIDGKMHPLERCLRSKRSLRKVKSVTRKSKKWGRDSHHEILQINEQPLPEANEEGEAIGIITLEDVIEELLQEEIYDETDHHAEG